MRERRDYTDAFKRKAVERILAGRISVAGYSEEKEVSPSVVMRWVRDKRWGGNPNFVGRRGNGAANGGLPTMPKTPSKRAKRPVPVTYACPHCGGLIDMGGDT